MRLATRTLIVAYVFGTLVWGFALFGSGLVNDDPADGLFVVMAFGYSQAFLAVLFFISGLAAALSMRAVPKQSAKNYIVIAPSFISFALTSWYCYFFFHS
jgi:hypothetical protein